MMVLLHRNIKIPTADYKNMTSTTTTTSIAHLSVQCVHRSNTWCRYCFSLTFMCQDQNSEWNGNKRDIKKNMNLSITHLRVRTNSKKESNLAVFFLRGSPKYITTPKLVVFVKLQATRSSQLFVEKGVLVASAIKSWEFNHKLVHTTRSWYSMHQIPFLFKTKQNEKQSPPTSRTCLPSHTLT